MIILANLIFMTAILVLCIYMELLLVLIALSLDIISLADFEF